MHKIKHQIGKYQVLLFAIIGIFVLLLLSPIFLKDYIQKEIKRIVTIESNGAYQLNWENLKINIWNGGIKIENFEFKPDYNLLENNNQESAISIKGKLLEIKRFSYFQFFINKKFSLGELLIADSHIDFFVLDNDNKKTNSNFSAPNIWIKRLKSRNVSYRIYNKKNESVIVQSDNFHIDISNFDVANHKDISVGSGSLFFNSLVVGSNKGQFFLDSLHINVNDKSLLFETGPINLTHLIEDLSGEGLKVFKDSVLDITMDNFKLFIIDFWDIINIVSNFPNSSATIDSLVMVNPKVVYNPLKAEREGDKSMVNPLTEKNYLNFNIKSVLLQNGKFESLGKLDNRSKSSVVDSIFIKVSDFRPAPETFDFPFIFDELELRTGSVIYNSFDSLSSVIAKGTYLSSKYKTFQLFGFEYRENLEEEKYFKLAEFQTDLPNIRAKEIRINEFQYKRFLRNSEFIASKVLVSNSNLTFIRDKNYKFKGEYKDLPNSQIIKIPIQFYIKDVEIIDGKVSYIEIPYKKKSKASFWMDNSNFIMYNFTNIIDSLYVNDSLRILGSTKLFGQGFMQVDILLKVLDELNYQKVIGRVEPFNIESLNDMSVPAAGIELKGIINHLNFEFEIKKDQSKGWVDIAYDDLRVSIITLNKQGRKRKSLFKSLFFNLLVNNTYPKEGEVGEKVNFVFNRDKKKWVINFWWKSLVEGIQETFDDDINEIKKIGEIIENIKNTLTEMEESANQRRKSREVDK